MAESPYLSVRDAASVLGISKDGVRKLIRRGKLRAVRRSERNLLIPRPAFEAYLRKLNGGSDTVAAQVTPPLESFEDRWARFKSTVGLSPEDWVAAWRAGDDDDLESMQIAAVAVGLVAERPTPPASRVRRRAAVSS